MTRQTQFLLKQDFSLFILIYNLQNYILHQHIRQILDLSKFQHRARNVNKTSCLEIIDLSCLIYN
jgi:hypothetical protein